MITNLFSSFDPSTIINISFNWLSSLIIFFLITPLYWVVPSKISTSTVSLKKTLHKEFKTLLGQPSSNGLTIILIALFTFILINNFMGLFPYVFTSSSHITLTLGLALPLWLTFIIFGWVNNTSHIFAHIVPSGTPGALIPFIVLIESIRNLIRPITLSIRLIANIVAGHLLITLLGNQTATASNIILVSLIFTQILLLTLEAAVAIIQSYVFCRPFNPLLKRSGCPLMIVKSNHSFHLVDISPWPLTGAIGALLLTRGLVKWFNTFSPTIFIFGKIILILTCIQWWRDIRRERSFQGLHTKCVARGMRWGMILFITSEVLFFFSFFLSILSLQPGPYYRNWVTVASSRYLPI